MNPLRVTSTILSAVGVLALGVVMIVPWGSFHAQWGGTTYTFPMGGGTVPGFDVTVQTRSWDHHASSNGNQDSTSWYSKDADDRNGVDQFRTAIPFLVAATVLAFAAALVTPLRPGPAGPALALVAAAFGITATVLYAVGTDAFFSDADYAWGPAFYLGIAACVCLLAAGISALVVPRMQGMGTPAGLE